MNMKEHYAAIGVSYNTLSMLKSVLKFSTIEEAYQFWKHQKDAKYKKKQHLIVIRRNYGKSLIAYYLQSIYLIA